MNITDVNLAMQKCHKNKVYVYPIRVLGKWYIERTVNGRVYRYQKEIDKSEQSRAMELTYINIANKL